MPEARSPFWAALETLAERRPLAVAIDDGRGGGLTRRELLDRADDLAQRLLALGLPTLALLADNGPAWAVADLAAVRAGLTLVPIPPFFSDEQLAHALRASGAGAVLGDTRQRLAGLGTPAPLGDLWCVRTGAVTAHPGVARITFTSGSTSAPKGVLLTADTLFDVTRSLLQVTGMGTHDRHLAMLPLAVLLENVAGLHRSLLAGACCLLPPLAGVGSDGASHAEGARLDAALRRMVATSAVLVPGSLDALVGFLEATGRHAPPLCRFLGVGGAPVPEHLLRRAAALRLPVYEGYGLSEAGSVVCLNSATSQRGGSVGRPLPHVRLAVLADGEIVVQAPRFAGYLGAPADEVDVSPWPTGDLGCLDDDGFLHVSGRKKAVFITSFGRNISAEWIERVLLDERALRQAVVFGEGLPTPVAVIVPRDDVSPQQVEACVQRANTRLPVYARVRRWDLAHEPFTPANGQWAATGGPRREVIARAHAALLEPADAPGASIP